MNKHGEANPAGAIGDGEAVRMERLVREARDKALELVHAASAEQVMQKLKAGGTPLELAIVDFMNRVGPALVINFDSIKVK